MCTKEKMSCTAPETSLSQPGMTEISALPSKGMAKDNPDHCDGCHLRVRLLDGNGGRVTI